MHIDRKSPGYLALSVGHVAGMIDMVALPLWVGTLIGRYHYTPAMAGAVVTLFLLAVVGASALVSPAFEKLPHRYAVTVGFVFAAAAFLAAALHPVEPDGLAFMAATHVVAGAGVGCALSITHGVIGRTDNPHRLFGIVNVALGVLGVAAFAGLPPLMAAFGAKTLFLAFSVMMTFAAIVSLLAFPRPLLARIEARNRRQPIPRGAWLVIGIVICLTFNQSMVFSFVQQVGLARDFGEQRVNGVLIVLGFVNLLPGGLAAALQNRLPPLAVGFAGPLAQAALALTLTGSTNFGPYAVATALYVSAVIFTHTFLFGLLARLDPTGRAVAATPAMMMIGSCTGPAAGGGIISVYGYSGLGLVATVVSAGAVVLMSQLRRRLLTPALAHA